MRRYAVWLISALVALPVYALASATGLPQLLVLVVTFLGAIVGTVIGTHVMPRR